MTYDGLLLVFLPSPLPVTDLLLDLDPISPGSPSSSVPSSPSSRLLLDIGTVTLRRVEGRLGTRWTALIIEVAERLDVEAGVRAGREGRACVVGGLSVVVDGGGGVWLLEAGADVVVVVGWNGSAEAFSLMLDEPPTLRVDAAAEVEGGSSTSI